MNLQKTDDGVICKFYGAPIWIEPDGKLVIDFKEPLRAVEFCQYLIIKNNGIISLPEIKTEQELV